MTGLPAESTACTVQRNGVPAATEGPGGHAERPRSVLIAEEHPAYRELVRRACEVAHGLRVAAEFEDASGAVGWWERHPADLPDIFAFTNDQTKAKSAARRPTLSELEEVVSDPATHGAKR